VLRLITDHDDDPAMDAALSASMLHRASEGAIGPTLRVFRPGRIVAFGSQDRLRPGYPAAVAAVADLGFGAVERLAGGRAAVFHEGTVAFVWTTPHPDPKTSIEARYLTVTSVVLAALERLDRAGTVGEIPGEYCPGRFSVHIGGHKVMGVGQRIVKRAAHVGGVLVVHSRQLTNTALTPVYRELGYDWNPGTTGAVGGSVGDAAAALIEAFGAAGYSLQPASFEPETLAMAADLAAGHRPPIR
jgi:octanoyl-[GcvH]:protein N-octanoyltransferase